MSTVLKIKKIFKEKIMKKNTKRTLVATLLVMILSLTVLVGSTFAYFNDVVNGTGNVTTGTLNTQAWVYYGDTIDADTIWENVDIEGDEFSFYVNDYKPGDYSRVYIKLQNAGSLTYDLIYKVRATDMTTDEYDIVSQFRYSWTEIVDYAAPDAATETLTDTLVQKAGTINDVKSVNDVADDSIVIVCFEFKMIDNAAYEAGVGTEDGDQSPVLDDAFASVDGQNMYQGQQMKIEINIEAVQNIGQYVAMNVSAEGAVNDAKDR